MRKMKIKKNSPVTHPTSHFCTLFCCKKRLDGNPGKCFSNVVCVNGLSGFLVPHLVGDNIGLCCSCNKKKKINKINFMNGTNNEKL